MRFVQLNHPSHGRRTGLVDHVNLVLLHEKYPSLYDLVWESLESGYRIRELVGNHLSKEKLSYDRVYTGKDAWTLLPSFDHPRDPMHCVVSGTGLTHKTSAENRSEMHRKAKEKEALSDSMRMYLMGEEGGKPAQGAIGVQPEWFYKGNGTVLRGHASSLQIPAYALDGGEEPEIAGLYVVDSAGMPVRIGMSQGNEFSDHGMEQKNYLYPEFADAWYNLALLKETAGDQQAARACLERAIAADPDYADPVYSLARLQFEMGRFTEASRMWQRYLALDPDSEWSRRARSGLALCQQHGRPGNG
jgi:hypothetical protein